MRYARALAAAQTVPVRGDVNANIAQHLELAHAAAERGAEVVVFPELSLTGYELDLGPALAFSEGDRRLAPLSEAARALRSILIVGAPLRLDGSLHIAAFILYPDGTQAVHTKRHLGEFSPEDCEVGSLPPAERVFFAPGTQAPLVKLASHQAAVAVCAESLQPWVPKEAAQRGAKTYLTSHFSLPQDREQRLVGLAKMAVHYDMAVAFANYGGPTAGLKASGGSTIFSQNGVRLGQLEAQGKGVAIAIEDAGGFRAHAVML
jgi:predicted amidohydrolase